MPESAYNNYHKNSPIFTVIEEKPEEKPIKEKSKKPTKPKEEIENVEEIQLNSESKVNSSGEDKKETGV